jgi:putative addiction module component (TIGR02574 family)
MNTSLFDQVRQLSVEEQIELVEALWDNIVERNAVPVPTEAQKAELDRRLSEHAAHPDDVVPWGEVKHAALTRIRRWAYRYRFVILRAQSSSKRQHGTKVNGKTWASNS